MIWEELEKIFEGYPAQEKVIKLILSRGFSVNEDLEITSGNIRIPKSQLADEAGVDRKAVDYALEQLSENRNILDVFSNLESIPMLRKVASNVGLGVTVITPTDASGKGILGKVANCISENEISIRQAIADDPKLSENPKLTIVTEKKVPGKVVDKLRKIEGVREITIN